MNSLHHSFLVATLTLAMASCGKRGPGKPAPTPVKSRGAAWAATTPAQAGLDESALREFAREVGGNGVVIRHDALAFTWGEPGKPLDVASASKPVMTHLVLKALEDGKISSMDETVGKWLPELAPKDAGITWRHLTTQTSCYGVAEMPGTAYDYNDFQTALLWKLIYEKVNPESPEDINAKVLGAQLFDQLEAQDRPRLRLETDASKARGRLVISARDFARVGSLYMREGKWKGRQVLSAEHVRQAIHSPLPASLPRTLGVDAPMLPGQPSYGGGKNQEDHLGCYSHMWWVNTGRRLWPSLPEDAFAAVGNGGIKVMLVAPGLDLIVSWNDANLPPQPLCGEGRRQMDALLAKLVAAVRDPAASHG